MAEEQINFYDSWGLSDEDVGLIQTKGFADGKSLLDSYKNLEKHLGADKADLLRIPRGEGADLSEVWNKLGRPETSDKYDLPDTVEKEFKDKFFELGLSSNQAKSLVAFADEWAKGHQPDPNEGQKELEKIRGVQLEAVKKEWGSNFEENKNLAELAVADLEKSIGLDADTLDKLGDVIGVDKALKLFATIGQQYKSGTVVQKNYLGNGGETPEMAKHKLQVLKNDTEFQKKIASGNQEALRELDRLIDISFKK